MKDTRLTRTALVVAAVLGLTAVGYPQLKQAIKVIGVGAAVKQFGPQINKEFNKLTGHKDTDKSFTKVVPIITVGLNTRGGIGAAQVMGSKSNVEKVVAVAAPEIDLFGREIRIQALIPVDKSADLKDIKTIKAVDGVGVSGIVDLKL